MLVSFPHMGELSIVLKALFTGLGQEVILPPPTSKRTLELGVKYSPETVCLPFKTTLGNFIEALEQGADTLVTCGGVGPCRLGYYAEVQKGILQKLGYNFEMIIIEPDFIDILKKLHRVASGLGVQKIYSAFHLAINKMNALDSLQLKVHTTRPYEVTIGESDAFWKLAVDKIDAAKTSLALKDVLYDLERRLDNIKLKPAIRPVRIGIVGEIFVMLEPFINLNLERRLGQMGVEVHKTMYLSDYVNGHLLRKSEYLKLFRHLALLAHPYLGHYVGGHGLKTIAHTVHMGEEDYDGIIHVFPFTCMPEVVAKNILHQVSDDANIPVLSIAFDEQSGEAGLVTRLEAFIDLLRYRRVLRASEN